MRSQPWRILIVDDNEMNRNMLSRRLDRKGFVVTVTSGARMLAERIKQDAVDLLLLDIAMPDIDGFEALQQLRKEYSRVELPVIMVTAKNQSEDIIRAFDSGANDYLTKPIDFPVALARIQTHLSIKEAEQSSREREQGRIGQDLHDDLGQHLTGIAFMSKLLERKLADQSQAEAADAAKIVHEVNEAINKTRELSRGLLTVSSEAEGLMSTLERWTDEVRDRYGIACRFICQQPVLVYDDHLATHLFRIAQEGVNNAIKHARPTRIDITLEQLHGVIAMSIRDNGVGLPKDLENSAGIGMRIMKHRAKMIGGTLQVKPCLDGGTVITCHLEAGLVHTNQDRGMRFGEAL